MARTNSTCVFACTCFSSAWLSKLAFQWVDPLLHFGYLVGPTMHRDRGRQSEGLTVREGRGDREIDTHKHTHKHTRKHTHKQGRQADGFTHDRCFLCSAICCSQAICSPFQRASIQNSCVTPSRRKCLHSEKHTDRGTLCSRPSTGLCFNIQHKGVGHD